MERKTILVVEDNRDELLIYTTLLVYRGYDVVTASRFDDALNTAVERQPHLALVDVNLGDETRDGCDLVRALRDDERTRGMPIIAHTAFGDVYHQRLARSGCETIIHKPTDPTILLEEVERLIGASGETVGRHTS